MNKIISVLLISLMGMTLNAQKSDKAIVKKNYDAQSMKRHVYYLASDELKGRNTPSVGQELAAQYIKKEFVQYGVKPVAGSYFQDVPMRLAKPMAEGNIKIGEKSLNFPKDFIMMDAENVAMDGELVFVNYGTAEDYKTVANVEGKIAVMLCGSKSESNPRMWFRMTDEKQQLAKEQGAIGVIELFHSTRFPWKYIAGRVSKPQVVIDVSANKMGALPHFWVNASEAEIVNLFKQPSTVNIETKGIDNNRFNVKNVVGMVEGTDPKLKEEYIIYSAHYDHVGVGAPDARGDSIYNGARDNAAGTAAVLNAAANIAKHPTKRSALFVLFTGEEKGLLGSSHFVDNAPVPLEKIAYCFNIDGAGYNDTKVITVIGLERTTVRNHFETACKTFKLKAIQDKMPEQNLFDRSDNVNFARKGIPAPTFSLGITSFDDEIIKYYHQAGDNPNTMDYKYLTKYCKSFIYAGRLIANDPAKHFWVKGDKYYDAGVKLYGQP